MVAGLSGAGGCFLLNHKEGLSSKASEVAFQEWGAGQDVKQTDSSVANLIHHCKRGGASSTDKRPPPLFKHVLNNREDEIRASISPTFESGVLKFTVPAHRADLKRSPFTGSFVNDSDHELNTVVARPVAPPSSHRTSLG